MRRSRAFRLLVVMACLLLVPLVPTSGHAAIEHNCMLHGVFNFATTPNQFGRYHVDLEVAGTCFKSTDLEHDIGIPIDIFLTGSAAKVGRCSGDQTISGLDMNGFYSYSIDARPPTTINIEAKQWAAPYVFPGPSGVKLIIRYDGTQPSLFPGGNSFAAGFIYTRVYGMCPPTGDNTASWRFVYSNQP